VVTSRRSGRRRAAERGRQIRVDLGRLDRLMKQVGELVVAKNRWASWPSRRAIRTSPR
jgi:chemotaxis protein histidine kinase CheA